MVGTSLVNPVEVNHMFCLAFVVDVAGDVAIVAAVEVAAGLIPSGIAMVD